MRLTTTLAAAAAIAVTGAAANAGGLAPVAVETPVVVIEEPMMDKATGSIPSTFIVAGLLAALVAAAGSF